MYRLLVIALLFALIPSSAFNMFDPISEKAKIRAICVDQVDAWRMRDFDKEASVWAHETYIMKMLTNGMRTQGWETIGSSYEADFKNTPADFEPDFFTELSDFYIHISGKNAWAVFDQHQIFPNDAGDNELYESLEFRCLEKIDGQWKIVFQLTGPYDKGEEEEIMEQARN